MNYLNYTQENIPLGKDGWLANIFSANKNTDNWNKQEGSVTIGGKTYSTKDRNDVVALQDYLIDKGYNLGVTKGTGYFGKNTQAALNKHFASPVPVTTQSSTQPQPETSPSFFTNAKNTVASWFTKDEKPANSWDKSTGAISLDGKTYNTSNRNDVAALQNYLIGKGHNVGGTGADGLFGKNTQKALTGYLNKGQMSGASNPLDPSQQQYRSTMLELANRSHNPALKAAAAKINQNSAWGQNDSELIKHLQARYNLPVTGKMDEVTLKRFNKENSFLGRMENVLEGLNFGAKGSVGSQYARIGRAMLPGFEAPTLNRTDFTNSQRATFDNLLMNAFNAKDGTYSVSGAQYTDGYAGGHYGVNDNIFQEGLDILSGNDQHQAAMSIGGNTVSVYTLPNGKRVALMTDKFDFNNAASREEIQAKYDAIDANVNLSEKEKRKAKRDITFSKANAESIVNSMLDGPTSYTEYGIYSDGTTASPEDIAAVLQMREQDNRKRQALASKTNLGNQMYTKWTGAGNTYKGSTTIQRFGGRLNYQNYSK